MAKASVVTDVKLVIELNESEASILMAMMQNGDPAEGEIAEGVRIAIFMALQKAGVS